eukprot:3544498-Pleurochrysis_carterae.AAC.2
MSLSRSMRSCGLPRPCSCAPSLSAVSAPPCQRRWNESECSSGGRGEALGAASAPPLPPDDTVASSALAHERQARHAVQSMRTGQYLHATGPYCSDPPLNDSHTRSTPALCCVLEHAQPAVATLGASAPGSIKKSGSTNILLSSTRCSCTATKTANRKRGSMSVKVDAT